MVPIVWLGIAAFAALLVLLTDDEKETPNGVSENVRGGGRRDHSGEPDSRDSRDNRTGGVNDDPRMVPEVVGDGDGNRPGDDHGGQRGADGGGAVETPPVEDE